MKILICDICNGPIEIQRDFDGNPIWNCGHNAQPLADGRCCDGCHMAVLAERINNIAMNREVS